MDATSNPAMKTYLNEVKRSLLHIVPTNKEFLDALEQDLLEYVMTHPNCTVEDIISDFGPPDAVALQQIETLEQKDIMRISRRRKITFALIIAFILVIIVGIYYIIELSDLSNGYETLTLELGEPGYIDDSVLE